MVLHSVPHHLHKVPILFGSFPSNILSPPLSVTKEIIHDGISTFLIFCPVIKVKKAHLQIDCNLMIIW